MLYISTRSRTDSFTAHRVLHEDRAKDGGMFVPMRMPAYTTAEIQKLRHSSFGENIAFVLNAFFDTNLTGWDVDFLIGRQTFRLNTMNHRMIIGELWHNLDTVYSYTEQTLYNKLAGTQNKSPTDWAKIAIRIAVLFGLFSELTREGIREADVAVQTGDFTMPMAAWYARQMGLPIGMIICGCNNNSSAWDLIHRGEMSINPQVKNVDALSAGKNYPEAIERLIFSIFGLQEVRNFLNIVNAHGVYTLQEEDLLMLNKGLFSAVVSNSRIRSILESVYRTNAYSINEDTAVAFGALQDYRASTGESQLTLLMSDSKSV